MMLNSRIYKKYLSESRFCLRQVLIIGLGNPGQNYTNTRHNVGFRVIDEFARENNFPDFRLAKKYNALISEKDDILLLKPQTFMNESGKSVKKLVKARPRRNLVVIHDDIDLPLEKIKIVKNRGAAGHKGVESIIREIGTKDFIRFRIGIQPRRYHGLVRGTEKFVLQKFSKDEEEVIKEVIKKAVEAIELTLKQGLEKTMSKYN